MHPMHIMSDYEMICSESDTQNQSDWLNRSIRAIHLASGDASDVLDRSAAAPRRHERIHNGQSESAREETLGNRTSRSAFAHAVVVSLPSNCAIGKCTQGRGIGILSLIPSSGEFALQFRFRARIFQNRNSEN